MPNLALYLDYKRYGILPYAGGLLDQDPAMMDDFRRIDGIVARHKE